jgi:hypothetical protein
MASTTKLLSDQLLIQLASMSATGGYDVAAMLLAIQQERREIKIKCIGCSDTAGGWSIEYSASARLFQHDLPGPLRISRDCEHEFQCIVSNNFRGS